LDKLASLKRRSRLLVQDAPTGPEGTRLWVDDFAGLLRLVQTERHTLATVMDKIWLPFEVSGWIIPSPSNCQAYDGTA